MGIDQILNEIGMLQAHAQEYHQAAQLQIDAGGERLARAMEREGVLRARIAELEAANTALTARVAEQEQAVNRMQEHPEIRARRLKEAQDQLAAAQARVDSLTPKDE